LQVHGGGLCEPGGRGRLATPAGLVPLPARLCSPVAERLAAARTGTSAAAGGFAALAAGRGREIAVLGEAALLAGHACAALAGDLAPAFRIHRSEPSAGARLSGLDIGHEKALLLG